MKIFIINLERNKARKKQIQEEISRIFTHYPQLKEKISFKFFKAIDAKKQDLNEYSSFFPSSMLSYSGRGGGISQRVRLPVL